MSDITDNSINRREALRRTALLLGGIVSAPTALGFLNGCSARSGIATKFAEDEAEMLTQISEIMIPATDTPGAKDMGVVNYIEDMVFIFYDDEQRGRFLDGMNAFSAKAEESLGKPFNNATADEQTDFVYAEHEALFGGEVNWNAPRPFLWTMKELTITGFFSSEAGMTQVLQYKQVPGRYEACITFEDAGGKVHAR